MRVLAALCVFALASQAQELPLTGISHVNFRVTDLEKARAFYTGLLGYPQAFFTGRNGTVGTAYLKVNDEQYIEISPGLKEGVDQRLTHVSFVTTDIEKLHAVAACGRRWHARYPRHRSLWLPTGIHGVPSGQRARQSAGQIRRSAADFSPPATRRHSRAA